MIPTDDFRAQLLRQLRLGNWKKMNFIEPPFNSSDYEPYANAVWEIRDRLTALTIHLSRVEWVAGIKRSLREHLADRIELFGKLETLVLKASEEQDMADFDIYINKCLLLRNLTVQTTFMPSTVQNDRVVPKPLVKTLRQTIVPSDDNALVYMMRKFPSLSSLTLGYNGLLPSSSSMNITSQFVSYVLKIPDLHIPKLEVENGFQLVAQNFPKSTYLGKNVSLSVDYDGGSYLTISRDTCNIDYPLSIKISQPATPEPPHLALLEEIGQTLKRLDFSMKKTKDVSTREKWRVQNGFVNDMVKGYYLDHIIQHCPNLKHLQLNYAMIFHCNSLANTIWNIKYLCLQRCFVKLEIFRKISSQIPTLDVLSLKYCHVATDENPLKEEESLYSLNMPYTSIGSLALYIARRNHMERAVALTVVNTTTGTTKYYIELGNRRGSINNQTDLGVSAASFSWFQRETVGLSLHVRCAGVALIYC